MHLLASLPFLSLAAATLHPRDAATVNSVLTDISNQINALDAVVKAYTSGPIDALTAANDKLLQTITSGTATIKGSAPLSEGDATSIAQSVINLNGTTATAVDDIIAKKPAFDAAGVGGTVLQSLQAQAAASGDFAAALTALTPADLAPVASSLSAAIAANLARGVAAYQGDTNTAPPTTSGGGGATTPPPASGTGTSGSASKTGTHPHSSGTTGAPAPSCSTGSNAPNGTLSATQTAPPAQYTPGSGAGRAGALGGAVVGVVALVPVLFL
jgi:hypothetical protein